MTLTSHGDALFARLLSTVADRLVKPTAVTLTTRSLATPESMTIPTRHGSVRAFAAGVTGSSIMARPLREVVAPLAGQPANGTLEVSVSSVVPLERAADALGALTAGKANGKIVVTVQRAGRDRCHDRPLRAEPHGARPAARPDQRTRGRAFTSCLPKQISV